MNNDATETDSEPEVPREPNRRQRRAEAAQERKRSRKLAKELERQSKVAYERTRLASAEKAAQDYKFG